MAAVSGTVAVWPGGETAFAAPNDSLWDTVLLAGTFLPGLAAISGTFGRKVHVKQSPGSDGATQTIISYELAEFEINLRIWTADHFATYQQLIPTIQPKPGKGSLKPVDIWHPSLHIHGIKKVLVLRASMLKPSSIHGVFETTLSVREWRPEPAAKTNAVTTPQQSLDLENKFQQSLPEAHAAAKPSANPAVTSP